MGTGTQNQPNSGWKAARPAHGRNSFLQVKVYVVLRRVYRAEGSSKPNIEILDVKLSMTAAEAIRDQYTGTWIERWYADKQQFLSDRT